MLGGNASSEVRLWVFGATSHMGNNNRWAREGGIVDELPVGNTNRNPEENPYLVDALLLEKAIAEANLTLLLNTSVYEVEKAGGGSDRIAAAIGFCARNSTRYELRAPLFCDASGDAWVADPADAAPALETQLFRNIAFRNIDVLEHAGAAIRSDCSDWALCENLRFEGFTGEAPGRVIEIVIARTRYSNDNGYRDERGRIRGLHFTRVTSPAGDIVLKGHDAAHDIDGVTFEDCVVGGNPIQSRADITTNEFVRNISFRTR